MPAMHIHARILPLILFILVWLAAAAPAAEIVEARWGFDGRVLPGHFNPLALLVHNPGPAPFDGALEVSEGGLVHQGAPWRVPCYLAPGTSRWVQVHPWIGEQDEPFQVRWLPGGGTSELDKPTFGAPATVQLQGPGEVRPAHLALKTFPDELFPTTVLATDGLACVVLDHAPRWLPAQRQALRDWVWRGGTLYLLPAPDGSQARFSQELEFINQVATRQPCGAGVVLRHAGERSTFDESSLASAGVTAPVLHQEDSYAQSLSSGLFQLLTQLVRPHHPWGMIYLVLIGYLLLLGPGAWLAARRYDFRLINAALVALIAVTSTVMWLVGQRGYGEHAALTSLAYAQALGEGDFAVTEWSSAFVTSSDRYEVGHPGSDNFYACPSDSESVEAMVLDDGANSRLSATIPLYSSRPFIHSGRRTIPGLAPVVTAAEADGNALHRLAIAIGGADQQGRDWSARIRTGRAAYAGRIYDLTWIGRVLSLSGTGTPLAEFAAQARQAGIVHQFDRGDETGALRIEQLDQRFPALIAYGLGGQGVQRQWSARTSAPGQVALFLLVELPPAFVVPGGLAQDGRTVFRFDLALPPPAPAAPATRNAP